MEVLTQTKLLEIHSYVSPGTETLKCLWSRYKRERESSRGERADTLSSTSTDWGLFNWCREMGGAKRFNPEACWLKPLMSSHNWQVNPQKQCMQANCKWLDQGQLFHKRKWSTFTYASFQQELHNHDTSKYCIETCTLVLMFYWSICVQLFHCMCLCDKGLTSMCFVVCK